MIKICLISLLIALAAQLSLTHMQSDVFSGKTFSIDYESEDLPIFDEIFIDFIDGKAKFSACNENEGSYSVGDDNSISFSGNWVGTLKYCPTNVEYDLKDSLTSSVKFTSDGNGNFELFDQDGKKTIGLKKFDFE